MLSARRRAVGEDGKVDVGIELEFVRHGIQAADAGRHILPERKEIVPPARVKVVHDFVLDVVLDGAGPREVGVGGEGEGGEEERRRRRRRRRRAKGGGGGG